MVNNRFLKEAVQIGDNLLSAALSSGSHIWWETNELVKEDGYRTIKSVSSGLYNGVDGISLFFVELYRCTGEARFLAAAKKSFDYLNFHFPTIYKESPSLYTGIMSFSILATWLCEVTKMSEYREAAIDCCLRVSQYLSRDLYEFIHGSSGTVLGLLLVFDEFKDKRVLTLIESFLFKILKEMKLFRTGVYWDLNGNYVQSLTGFSHGVSGINYMFKILSLYFKNSNFVEVVKYIEEYEELFFNSDVYNWEDLRGADDNIYWKEIYSCFVNEDFSFLKKKKFMNAWCHGAPGIGITKLLDLIVYGERRFLEACIRSLKYESSVLDFSTNSACLCHGVAGNFELFIEIYSYTNEIQFLDEARSIGNRLLEWKQENGYYLSGSTAAGEDISLFLGNVGVGMFFLRLYKPLEVPSILFPRPKMFHNDIGLSEFSVFNLSNFQIFRILLETNFPYTYKYLLSTRSDFEDYYCSNGNFFQDLHGLVKSVHDSSLYWLYEFERSCFDWFVNFPNKSFIQLNELYWNECRSTFIQQIKSEPTFSFVLSNYCRVFEIPSDPDVFVDIFGGNFVLVRITAVGLRTVAISKVIYYILKNSIDRIDMSQISSLFDLPDDLGSNNTILLDIVLSLLSQNILVSQNYEYGD